MTRKDFELIARVLSEARAELADEYVDYMAHRFADALVWTSERFDRARFLRAAGVEQWADRRRST